jgi:phosphosulfolactate synthase (CoM biosynthesis protein A)
VHAGKTELERDLVQLADDAQDVLRGALKRGAHRVDAEAHAILAGEAALDLRDVRRGAGVLSAQAR